MPPPAAYSPGAGDHKGRPYNAGDQIAKFRQEK